MTFYQQARKFMNLRVYVLLAFLILGAIVSTFGNDIAGLLVHPCGEAPRYRQDVPAAIRTEIDLLHANGLLYCSGPVQGLASMSEPVYWGSDGLRSVLFFQADRLETIGVTRYGFGAGATGQAFVPGEPGASPPDGFREVMLGRPTLVNQAPAGADYYFRLQGAPVASDAAVSISLTGPATPYTGAGSRDVFRDIEMAVAWLQRKPPQVIGETTVRNPIAIQPGRWRPLVRRTVAPALAEPGGTPSYRALAKADPTVPTLYQVETGLLDTTVWVAGVVTGTHPALALAEPGGTVLQPQASALWVSATSKVVLAHFAFEPIAAGTALEVRYWSDGKNAASTQPDYRWQASAP